MGQDCSCCSCLCCPSCRSCWPQLCACLGGCSNRKSKALLEINEGPWLCGVLEDLVLCFSCQETERNPLSLWKTGDASRKPSSGLKMRSLCAQRCFGLNLGNISFARTVCVLTSQICCSSSPAPRFALEKEHWWFLEREPSNPPSENNKTKSVIAFGLEQSELGVNWPRRLGKRRVLWGCRAGLGTARDREWCVNQDQPPLHHGSYPVSQSKPTDAQGSAAIKPGVKPQLGHGCVHRWANGATGPGLSWVFLAPVED